MRLLLTISQTSNRLTLRSPRRWSKAVAKARPAARSGAGGFGETSNSLNGWLPFHAGRHRRSARPAPGWFGKTPAWCDITTGIARMTPASCGMTPASCGMAPASCGMAPASCGMTAASCGKLSPPCGIAAASSRMGPASCDKASVRLGTPPALNRLAPDPGRMIPAPLLLRPLELYPLDAFEKLALWPETRANIGFGQQRGIHNTVVTKVKQRVT